MAEDVDAMMDAIPEQFRKRWCREDACACLGCVQMGNRLAIAKMNIPPEDSGRFTITKAEWDDWMGRQALALKEPTDG